MPSTFPATLDSFTDNVDDVDDVLAADGNLLHDAIEKIEADIGAHADSQMAWGNILSPASIGASQNDYNPTGLSTARVLRLTASGAVNITGLAGGAAGRVLVVHNIGANTITLKDENASSSAANRFALNADIAIAADQMTILWYDNTSSRWRALAIGGGGGGVATDTIFDAKGDLPAGTGADTAARLAVGANGQKVKANSAQATGLEWVDDIAVIAFVIDGGGAAITTGQKGHLEIPFACTILQVTTLADQSGSIVIDVWKDTYANFPPTVADTITASAKPTLTSAQKAQDGTLTGWTTSIAAGDILAFNVDSATTVQRVLLSLKVKKT